jgi:hypothetical protein
MSNDHTIKSTKILPCTCEHVYQDSKYGKYNRIFNPRKDNKYACTVCGKEKTNN